MYFRYAGTLTLMSRRMTVLAAPRTILSHAAGRSLDMMIRQPLTPIYVKSGFLRGCNGGANIN
jgi:hypothetical protein